MEASSITEKPVDLDSSGKVSMAMPDEYAQTQLRIYLTTLFATAFSVAISLVFFDFHTSLSLLIGGLSGVIYMRLLARNVGKLRESSKQVGKIQLVIPVLLVLAVSKLPQLELIPALLGFLLYKPSLIIQVMLEPSTRAST